MSPDPALDPDALWARLVRGAVDRRHAFREVALATVDAQRAPQNRTVILRGVDPASRRLWVHTDARSPKAAEIEADPRVALVFWDPKARLQLRCRAVATLRAAGAFADAEWAKLNDPQQRLYGGPQAPGAPLEAVADAPDPRATFRVVDCVVSAIDALSLDRAGHRRRLVAIAADGTMTSQEIAP